MTLSCVFFARLVPNSLTPLITPNGLKPVKEMPGLMATLALMMVRPVFETVLAATTAKSAAVSMCGHMRILTAVIARHSKIPEVELSGILRVRYGFIK